MVWITVKNHTSVTIQVSKAHSWTCMDLYVFATPYRVSWDYYFLSREHTFEFKEWEGKTEYEYVSGCHFPIERVLKAAHTF